MARELCSGGVHGGGLVFRGIDGDDLIPLR